MRLLQLCFVALFSSELIDFAYTSIAGVSFRDDFNFEDRYRKHKLQEGPPVFWYLGNVPVMPQMPQIVPQMSQIIPQAGPQVMPQVVPQIEQQIVPQVMPQIMPQMLPQLYIELDEYCTTTIPTTQRVLSPFEALFESFKRDISKEPVAPRVEMTKELGRVHVYRQPVSYETMKMIEKLTNAYAKSMH